MTTTTDWGFSLSNLVAAGDYGFWDWEFTDSAPGSELRLWVLTFDVENARWYANKRQSGTVDDMFDDGEPVTDDELAQLVAAIPADMHPCKAA